MNTPTLRIPEKERPNMTLFNGVEWICEGMKLEKRGIMESFVDWIWLESNTEKFPFIPISLYTFHTHHNINFSYHKPIHQPVNVFNVINLIKIFKMFKQTHHYTIHSLNSVSRLPGWYTTKLPVLKDPGFTTWHSLYSRRNCLPLHPITNYVSNNHFTYQARQRE